MARHLECACGAVQGTVETGPPVNHVVCYCRDCQAWAHHLGRAAEILDERGGSEIVQLLPKAVRFTKGADKLACMRMTGRGPLRWYTTCCNTPIGNGALSSKVAFLGLVSACLKKDPRPLDADFGPVAMRVFTAGAKGEPKPLQTPMWKLVSKLAGMTLKARLDGSWRTNPFFDARTGEPVATPQTATAKARAEALAKVA